MIETEIQPQSPQAQSLREELHEETWLARVEQARQRYEVFQRIVETRKAGASETSAAVTEGWSRSKFRYARRRLREWQFPGWEAMLDRRVPPVRRLPARLRQFIQGLRMVDPSIRVEAAQAELVRRFGRAGSVSKPTLNRVWAEAGLHREVRDDNDEVIEREELLPVPPEREEEMAVFYGGLSIALLGVASAETGVFASFGKAVVEWVKIECAMQTEMPEAYAPAQGPRTEDGRFAAGYNEHYREKVEPGDTDSRWHTDKAKRQRRDLANVQLATLSVDLVAARLFAMAVTPLITERRGFSGLLGTGEWLELAGIHPYMPRTLEKALSELALFDVSDALWRAYGKLWWGLTEGWRTKESSPAWLQCAIYVDSTQDPYWTRKFALSSKVARTNKVQPCLTQVVLAAGPGVPIVAEVMPGGTDIAATLKALLRRLDRTVGVSEIGRLVIVDSAMGTYDWLDAFHESEDHNVVTVLKGARLKSAEFITTGDWIPYRDKDEIREVQLLLKRTRLGKQQIPIRGVEMRRPGSRKNLQVVYVTDTDEEALPTAKVVDAYLSRWPNQEQTFRDQRNGGGLNRSHGYGGEYVTHAALPDQIDKLERQLTSAQTQVAQLQAAVSAAEQRLEVADKDDDGVPKAELNALKRATRQAQRNETKTARDLERRRTHPAEIYRRDTTRESIMTSLKLSAALLAEYVLREYFGGARMELRTFIEFFNTLPVTRITTEHEVQFVVRSNPRYGAKMEHLETAFSRINERMIHMGERQVSFHLQTPDEYAYFR